MGAYSRSIQMTQGIKPPQLRMGAICPAERRVRDKCFERENMTDAGPPPPRPLRLPTAAVVSTASVAFAAARILAVRGSVASYEAHTRARDPHWRPALLGDGHLLNLHESRDLGGFEYAVVVRGVCRPASLLASNTRAAATVTDAVETTAAVGSRSGRGGGGSASAMFSRSKHLSLTLLCRSNRGA